jgi:hypothetical protein
MFGPLCSSSYAADFQAVLDGAVSYICCGQGKYRMGPRLPCAPPVGQFDPACVPN